MANDKEKQDKVAEEVKVKAVGGDAKTVEGEKMAKNWQYDAAEQQHGSSCF